MSQQAQIGIIGGSGFYEFLKGQEVEVETSYGKPSDSILIAEHQGKKIAFLPRHGKKHQYPPHKINYRANLHALKQIGVKQVIAPCAVGSLKPNIEPGHFVIADQFIDRTKNRKDTFFNGPKTAHISTAEPYCPEIRNIIIQTCEKLNIAHHKSGTVLVIEGPRFSTRAESNFYSTIADVINMTQYPEVVLAKELEMCYANISLVTDYDAGLKGIEHTEPVSSQEVVKTFQQNTEKLKQLILEIIKALPEARTCPCGQALENARI